MVSIENFYWLLHHHLLKPVGLDSWYYYPFGTQDNLLYGSQVVDGQQRKANPKKTNHVLFHYDQEPLYDADFGYWYDLQLNAWSHKNCKLLANSERSQLKRKICRDRGMLDWYYFFHGFAALDWFKDAQYFDELAPIENAFISLNHLVRHKRSYRIALLAQLFDHGILDRGTVSFHGTWDDIRRELDDPWCSLAPHDRILISEMIKADAMSLPMTVDSHRSGGDFSAHFGAGEYRLWQKSLLHVVTETVFYEDKHHLTEKIFKPIVAQRPFVLASSAGSLEYLRGYGFKTFEPWIDEHYDSVSDPTMRMTFIADQVARVAKMTVTERTDLYQEMKPVLDYNKRHFFGEFRKIIAHELVDNFDSCCRIWNNGRVDDRGLILHPDLSTVKSILCDDHLA